MTRKLQRLVAASMLGGSSLTTGVSLIAIGCYVDSLAWTWAGGICLWLACAGAVWGMFTHCDLLSDVNTMMREIDEVHQDYMDLSAEYIRHVGGYDADDPKPKWCGTPRFSSN